MIVVPVINGRVPRIDGGTVDSALVDPVLLTLLPRLSIGTSILLAPYVHGEYKLHSVAVECEIKDMWVEDVYVNAPPVTKIKAVFCRLLGRGYVWVKSYSVKRGLIFGEVIENIDLVRLHANYPYISGAGWTPSSGNTYSRGTRDIEVTIEGKDTLSGKLISISAQLGGLLTAQQAHTLEHGIIRALKTYLLVTPKTLYDAIRNELNELKSSIDLGIKLKIPELFGVTATGACGNPLTNLAQLYLWEGLVEELREGSSPLKSIAYARRKTLSRITQDLQLSTHSGLRTLETLKRGMSHENEIPHPSTLAAVIRRFPSTPWH